MTEWAARRVWNSVTVTEDEDGYAIALDARPVRTPGKRLLAVPTRTIAERIAREWTAQGDMIYPRSMPWTRSANSALDKVATQRDEVEAHLIGYAGTDLLSYRAAMPEGLVNRQAEGWDPVLTWIAERFDVRLAVTSGVMPIEQPPEALERLAAAMAPMSPFQLTGFYGLVTLTGSFALALAAVYDEMPATRIWDLSRLDEAWQAEQWGEDAEAAEVTRIKRSDFLHAHEFYHAA